MTDHAQVSTLETPSDSWQSHHRSQDEIGRARASGHVRTQLQLHSLLAVGVAVREMVVSIALLDRSTRRP
ncbi:hypothetical protein Cob_v012107 [Colletotrichum orbiculare MAFF 240422]|uniref:Uncharacterized protein n=1 Tax=Colletotrichum orbiculare (strain 104-T / ATCC 96160 / CBS 514.97 / LARS 414 / MAFF 240422) TaxID=1213857 RepID=A0A484FC04_COLOR|nr:hypothetical protein Cob_v012107 [Colletotrichum orbiculare MAFF 240422]